MDETVESKEFLRNICRSVSHNYDESTVCLRCGYNGFLEILRNKLDGIFIGMKVTSGTLDQMKSIAVTTLMTLQTTGEITDFMNLSIKDNLTTRGYILEFDVRQPTDLNYKRCQLGLFT